MTQCVHWLAHCRGLMEFEDKIFHHPDRHPEPITRGEGELRWALLVRQPVASVSRGPEPPVPQQMMMSFIWSCRNKI